MGAARAGKGVPLSRPRLEDLAQRLLDVRHVAFIYGALDELAALALSELVRDLNHDRHAVTLALRGDGNARGAEDVLTWQTGFPGPVSFARGHPQEELGAAELLARGDVDAALVSPATCRRRGCHGVLDPRATATAQVVIAPAADGIEVAGTAHRMDGVPLAAARAAPERPPERRGSADRDRRAPLMLRIAGGGVHDPANGVDGEVRDVCVEDGSIVADVPGARPPHRRARHGRDAGRGRHPRAHRRPERSTPRASCCPTSTAPTPLARTEILRSGTGGTVPSTFTTGYRYARLGYTTVVDAATPPLAARHTLAELATRRSSTPASSC